MSRAGRDDKKLADLDELIEEITVDAYGDDEQLWAFRQAFEDNAWEENREERWNGEAWEGARWT